MTQSAAKCLTLRFWLRAYMRVPEYPIHLDSILHELIAQQLDVRADAPEAQAAMTAALDEILARDSTDPLRVYKASVLLFSGAIARHTDNLVRRNSTGAVAEAQLNGFLQRRGDQINTMSGRERNFLITYPAAWPEAIKAHAVVLDETKFRPLLTRLTHLGGGRRNGCGELAGIDVEDSIEPEAWKNRAFSVGSDNRIPMIGRCMPPYYARDARRLVHYEPDALLKGFC